MQSTILGFFVNMEKDNFIGRDALNNKDRRPCLFGVTCKTETPISGSKILDGDKIVGHITAGVPSPTLKLGIGYVPQGRDIFPQLSVKDNLRMGGFLNKKPSLDYDLVFNYFPFLKDRLQQRGGTLSGGQQEMLSIARALIGEPKLLILDEPSEGIQPNIVQEISEFLLDLNANHNITVLFVEQNIDFVKKVANRGYVMNKGVITNELNKEQLFNEEFLASQITI